MKLLIYLFKEILASRENLKHLCRVICGFVIICIICLFQKSSNLWTSDADKVNINLDVLSPASKYQKQQQPSMNQLQQTKSK